jgi:negative regulator of replication initiation
MPWTGRKKIAFVPLSRPNAHPPDAIPPDWENDILRRVLCDPDSTGRDRSLRAFIHTVSSGVADLDAIVTERHSIDLQDVPASVLEGELGARLRAEGCDAAAIVMLGGPGAGTNSGFWSRFVMLERVGTWAMEFMHGLTGFADLYPFGDDVDPHKPVIGMYDQMSAASATHPSAYTKAGIQWIDRATIAEHRGRVSFYALHAISLTQPPPTGRVAAVKIGASVPYLMVEARLKVDQFDAGIPKEGVIVYAVQTPDHLGHRVNRLRPVVLETPQALSAGEAFVSDAGIGVRVTAAVPGGFVVLVEDRNAPFTSGELLSYGDAGTPGNVSAPLTVGFGGWQAFTSVFAGTNLRGENRIYAVDQGGQLLSYGDAGTPGNVSSPIVVGFGGWQAFKAVFAGRNAAGENRIYAADHDGQLLSYGDAGTPGNVSSPVVVGFGGWQAFTHLFAGSNLAGENRIYAVDEGGQLLSYGDAGTPGNVSDPVVVGFGGWQAFSRLFAGRNLAGEHRIYAVDQQGQLLSYGDAGTPGNVSSPVVVGLGGWTQFKFLFAGRNLGAEERIYAVVT